EQPLLRGARRFRGAARPPPDLLAQRGLPLVERHRGSDPEADSLEGGRFASQNERSGQLSAAAPSKEPPPWPCGQLRWCPALWQVGPWWPASGFPVRRDY